MVFIDSHRLTSREPRTEENGEKIEKKGRRGGLDPRAHPSCLSLIERWRNGSNIAKLYFIIPGHGQASLRATIFPNWRTRGD